MMWSRMFAVVPSLVLCLLVSEGRAEMGEESIPYGDRTPYAKLAGRRLEYHGAKRSLPEPVGMAEVRIGMIGPTRGPRALPGLAMRRGAELALAEATAAGGYLGRPFRLVFYPDDGPWGIVGQQVMRLVYDDSVRVVMGSIGVENSHIAEQVITKAHVPLVVPGCTDPSLTKINIPWVFRCMPDDDAQARLLARYLFEAGGYTRVVGISANEHYGRTGMRAFEKVARRWHRPLLLSLQYNMRDEGFEPQLDRIERVRAQAVVIWGEPPEAALLIRRLREREMPAEISAGSGLCSSELLGIAGSHAEGVVTACIYDPERDDSSAQTFVTRFSEHYGEAPDAYAAYAYDGAQMVVRAIRRAGLNRARIRDALAADPTYRGAAGEIRFDGSGSNVSPPMLSVVRGGRFVRLPEIGDRDPEFSIQNSASRMQESEDRL